MGQIWPGRQVTPSGSPTWVAGTRPPAASQVYMLKTLALAAEAELKSRHLTTCEGYPKWYLNTKPNARPSRVLFQMSQLDSRTNNYEGFQNALKSLCILRFYPSREQKATRLECLRRYIWIHYVVSMHMNRPFVNWSFIYSLHEHHNKKLISLIFF